MPSIVDELTDVLGSLSRADDLAALEHRYLEHARRLLPGTAFGIYLFRPGTQAVEEFATLGVSDAFLSRYEEVGRHADPLLQKLISAGVPVDSAAMMSPSDWRASPIYRAVYGLHGFGQAVQTPILADGCVVGTLNFGGPAAGTFRAADIELTSALGRAVGLAASSVRERGSLARERDHARTALELTDVPVVVTDARSGRRYANAAARTLQDDLGVEGAWLEGAIAEARRSPDATCSIQVVDPGGACVTVVVRTTIPADDPAVSISLLQVAQGGYGRGSPSQALTGLTRREREVAELVAAGLRDAEVATRMYLSPFTVKGYIKSIYRKLGVRSRVDLTRLVLEQEPWPRSSAAPPADPPTTGTGCLRR